MKLKELKNLIDNIYEQDPDIDVYISFLIENKQKPIKFLQFIKKLSYAAFLRTTAFGTEVCVTDKISED